MSAPELSVILPMPIGHAAVARTLRHLRAQTACELMELIVMCPPGEIGAMDPSWLAGFTAGRVVEYARGTRLCDIRAAGVLAACAPVVVFAEDHCFPAPDWAAALIAAHRMPCAAVGPQFENANPDSVWSWADLYLNFGPAVAPAPRGPATSLVWHNTSYKRELLVGYAAQLGEMLEAEGLLQDALRAQGHQLWLEPSARTAHLNFSTARWFVVDHLVGGRVYGGQRVSRERWSPLRRIVYVCAGLLTPAARMPRIWRDIRRNREHGLLPRLIPALLLGLVAHALGEIAGYALGAGRASELKSLMEVDRPKYLRRADRLAAIG